MIEVLEVIDTSTCDQRLMQLAEQPEYQAIRGELLHAAAELKAMMTLHHDNQQPATAAMIEAGCAYMVDSSGGDHVKRWKPIDKHDLAGLFMAMWNAR